MTFSICEDAVPEAGSSDGLVEYFPVLPLFELLPPVFPDTVLHVFFGAAEEKSELSVCTSAVLKL